MIINELTTMDDLIKLDKGSTLVLENVDMSDENINNLYSIFELTENNELYHCTGAFINQQFELVDEDKYPDNIDIILITNFYDDLIREAYNGVWLDDLIVSLIIEDDFKDIDIYTDEELSDTDLIEFDNFE